MEDSLGHSHEDGASEGLAELDNSGANRNPFLRQDSLDDKDTDLETCTNTQAGDDLVAKPLPERGMNVEGCEHAASDSVENHAGDDDIVVVANGGDDTSRDDGAEDGSEQEREDLDSSLDGANTLDGLEVKS